jgi:hypothetical protein
MMCNGTEGISRGLKPALVAGFDAWAKAQAYLKSKSKNKSNNNKAKRRLGDLKNDRISSF